MNPTSADDNYVFVIFSIVNEWSEIVVNDPNCLFGINIHETVDSCW